MCQAELELVDYAVVSKLLTGLVLLLGAVVFTWVAVRAKAMERDWEEGLWAIWMMPLALCLILSGVALNNSMKAKLAPRIWVEEHLKYTELGDICGKRGKPKKIKSGN